jgi:DNA-binding transcriptional ArsR family regulator
MKALSHPTRVQILAILTERMASPVEIAKELGEGVSQVAYHVKVLRECGLIQEDHTIKRRGAMEHVHKSITPTIIPEGAWNNLPPALRRDISARIMRKFFDDAFESLKAGAFDGSPGELSWTPLILDTVGVEEMEQISKNFIEEAQRVQKKASKRLRSEKSSPTKNATAATIFLASFLSARSPKEGMKASATKRR